MVRGQAALVSPREGIFRTRNANVGTRFIAAVTHVTRGCLQPCVLLSYSLTSGSLHQSESFIYNDLTVFKKLIN